MLEVSGLTIKFGRRLITAVDDVAFQIAKGQRLGLIGESGSGKSVTALALMGLLPENAHVSGSICWQGQELVGLPDADYSRLRGDTISMVFQEPKTALDPTMMVGLQVAEVLRLHYARASEAAKYHAGPEQIVDDARGHVIEILSEVGLNDPERVAASYPHQLSGGQRQRVLIAMALINRPDLIIFDEPTTALDVTIQARVLSLIDDELRRRQTACLFISHDLAVVSQVCDQVMVMHKGQIVEHGAIGQILTDPQHSYTRQLVKAAQLWQAPEVMLEMSSCSMQDLVASETSSCSMQDLEAP